MSMNTAVSGLQAANQDLNTISNNIANANTVGYKSMNVQFADVYSATSASGGVYVSDIQTDFAQGTTLYTSSATDLAISGDGFFIMEDANGQQYYTRAGNFSTDKDGNLVNAQGQKVMGFAVDANGKPIEGQLVPLEVNNADLPAQATTKASIGANLDAREEVIDREDNSFDPDDTASYHSTTTTTLYDSQGNEQQVTAYYTKVGENEWDVYYKSGDQQIGPETMVFGSDGKLETPASGDFTLDLDFGNGSAAMELKMDVSAITQFGNDFSVSSNTQNGFAAGNFYGISIAEDGAIVATYSNGQSEIQGYVALATFPNNGGLQAAGNTSYSSTMESGDPMLGLAGSGKSGTLTGGALENSNVDMSMELVDMIVAQSAYQANTKTISTFNENTRTLMNSI
ncbi:MAG: flagellar hook protein FlgE [Endozoicomonas sp.]